jgi:hypothetical protein
VITQSGQGQLRIKYIIAFPNSVSLFLFMPSAVIITKSELFRKTTPNSSYQNPNWIAGIDLELLKISLNFQTLQTQRYFLWFLWMIQKTSLFTKT